MRSAIARRPGRPAVPDRNLTKTSPSGPSPSGHWATFDCNSQISALAPAKIGYRFLSAHLARGYRLSQQFQRAPRECLHACETIGPARAQPDRPFHRSHNADAGMARRVAVAIAGRSGGAGFAARPALIARKNPSLPASREPKTGEPERRCRRGARRQPAAVSAGPDAQGADTKRRASAVVSASPE